MITTAVIKLQLHNCQVDLFRGSRIISDYFRSSRCPRNFFNNGWSEEFAVNWAQYTNSYIILSRVVAAHKPDKIHGDFIGWMGTTKSTKSLQNRVSNNNRFYVENTSAFKNGELT